MTAILLVGVFAAAASGALQAGRRRLDVFGVVVAALVTALGGGTMRDILIGRRPLFWIAEPQYLTAALAGALATLCFARAVRPLGRTPRRAFLLLDAAGLAVFSLAGARVAESAGVPPAVTVLMGMISGVAGGLVRDVLCAEVPLVLRREIYATAALAGVAAYVLLEGAGFPRPAASAVGMAVVFGLRAAAVVWGLQPPVFVVGEGERQVAGK